MSQHAGAMGDQKPPRRSRWRRRAVPTHVFVAPPAALVRAHGIDAEDLSDSVRFERSLVQGGRRQRLGRRFLSEAIFARGRLARPAVGVAGGGADDAASHASPGPPSPERRARGLDDIASDDDSATSGADEVDAALSEAPFTDAVDDDGATARIDVAGVTLEPASPAAAAGRGAGVAGADASEVRAAVSAHLGSDAEAGFVTPRGGAPHGGGDGSRDGALPRLRRAGSHDSAGGSGPTSSAPRPKGRPHGRSCCGPRVRARVAHHVHHAFKAHRVTAVSNSVGYTLEEGFDELGGFVERHALGVAAVGIVVLLALAAPLLVSLATGTAPLMFTSRELWEPAESVSAAERDAGTALFRPYTHWARFMVQVEDTGNNDITDYTALVTEILRLEHELREMAVTVSLRVPGLPEADTTLTARFTDICEWVQGTHDTVRGPLREVRCEQPGLLDQYHAEVDAGIDSMLDDPEFVISDEDAALLREHVLVPAMEAIEEAKAVVCGTEPPEDCEGCVLECSGDVTPVAASARRQLMRGASPPAAVASDAPVSQLHADSHPTDRRRGRRWRLPSSVRRRNVQGDESSGSSDGSEGGGSSGPSLDGAFPLRQTLGCVVPRPQPVGTDASSRVLALSTDFELSTTAAEDPALVTAWLEAFEEVVERHEPAILAAGRAARARFAYGTSVAFDQESRRGIATASIGRVLLGAVAVVVFLAALISQANTVYSRVGLSLVTVTLVVLTSFAGMSVAVLAGGKVTPLSAVAVFLAMGVGVQWVASLVAAFDVHDEETSLAERNKHALSHAGSSAAVTTVMTVSAFAAGTSSQFAAISNFTAVAAWALGLEFLVLVTVVDALLVLDQRRAHSNRFDLFCCIRKDGPVRNTVTRPALVRFLVPLELRMSTGIFGEVMSRIVGPLLRSTAGRLGIVVAAAGLTLGAYSLWQVNRGTGSPIVEVLPDDSHFTEYVHMRDQCFADLSGDEALVLVTATRGDTTAAFAPLWAPLATDLSALPVVKWVQSPFLALATLHADLGLGLNNTLTTTEPAYSREMWDFVYGDGGVPMFRALLVFAGDPEHPRVKTAAIRVSTTQAVTTTEHVQTLHQLRGVVDTYNAIAPDGIHLLLYGDYFPLTEAFALYEGEMTSKLVRGGLIESGVLMLLLHPVAALIVAALIPAMDYCVLAWMPLVGLKLNPVTIIALVMAVSTTVDFAAHVAHHYTEEAGTSRYIRAADAAAKAASPLLSSAAAIALGCAFLLSSETAVVRQFPLMIVGVLIVACVFALLVLPAVLGFIGPTNLVHTSPIAKPAEDSRGSAAVNVYAGADVHKARSRRSTKRTPHASVAQSTHDAVDGTVTSVALHVSMKSRTPEKQRAVRGAVGGGGAGAGAGAGAAGELDAALATVNGESEFGVGDTGVPQVRSIVFAGGGAKPCAHAGAIAELEKRGLRDGVTRVAGTGIGSWAAMLFALGASAAEMKTIFRHVHLRTLLEGRSSVVNTAARAALQCIRRYDGSSSSSSSTHGTHLHSGARLLGLLRNCAELFGGDPDLTFAQLYHERGIELCVVAAQSTTMAPEYLHPKICPDLPIALAVHAASSLPGVVAPVRLVPGVPGYVSAEGVVSLPIRCMDGWWLSMAPRDSFRARLGGVSSPYAGGIEAPFQPRAERTVGIALPDSAAALAAGGMGGDDTPVTSERSSGGSGGGASGVAQRDSDCGGGDSAASAAVAAAGDAGGVNAGAIPPLAVESPFERPPLDPSVVAAETKASDNGTPRPAAASSIAAAETAAMLASWVRPSTMPPRPFTRLAASRESLPRLGDTTVFHKRPRAKSRYASLASLRRLGSDAQMRLGLHRRTFRPGRTRSAARPSSATHPSNATAPVGGAADATQPRPLSAGDEPGAAPASTLRSSSEHVRLAHEHRSRSLTNLTQLQDASESADEAAAEGAAAARADSTRSLAILVHGAETPGMDGVDTPAEGRGDLERDASARSLSEVTVRPSGGSGGTEAVSEWGVGAADAERVCAVGCDYVSARDLDLDVGDVNWLFSSGQRAMAAFLDWRARPRVDGAEGGDGAGGGTGGGGSGGGGAGVE